MNKLALENTMDAYVGLVHGPVMNKRGEEVTTSVTNLDIHDIARSVKTFGFKGHFLITPIVAQHRLVERILGHWKTDTASLYNPDRQNALHLVRLFNQVADAIQFITDTHGRAPLVVVTGANFQNFEGGAGQLVKKISLDKRPLFLLFGTGWGLPTSIVEKADFRLSPIIGASQDGYNHLSVRSAVAIYLDRLVQAILQ